MCSYKIDYNMNGMSMDYEHHRYKSLPYLVSLQKLYNEKQALSFDSKVSNY